MTEPEKCQQGLLYDASSAFRSIAALPVVPCQFIQLGNFYCDLLTIILTAANAEKILVRRYSMAKKELTFIFENPNPPKAVEQVLKKILLEKLFSKPVK